MELRLVLGADANLLLKLRCLAGVLTFHPGVPLVRVRLQTHAHSRLSQHQPLHKGGTTVTLVFVYY